MAELANYIWEFPKDRGAFLGVLRNYWGLKYIGVFIGVPVFWENYIYDERDGCSWIRMVS